MTRQRGNFRYRDLGHDLRSLMVLRDQADAAREAHLKEVPVRSTIIAGQHGQALVSNRTERYPA